MTADLAVRRVRLLEALRDVIRIKNDGGPSTSDLAGAPTLMSWFRMGPCLAGEVVGHPKISDGSFCITSAAIYVDPDEHWARTVSRFYILADRDPAQFD